MPRGLGEQALDELQPERCGRPYQFNIRIGRVNRARSCDRIIDTIEQSLPDGAARQEADESETEKHSNEWCWHTQNEALCVGRRASATLGCALVGRPRCGQRTDRTVFRPYRHGVAHWGCPPFAVISIHAAPVRPGVWPVLRSEPCVGGGSGA